MLQRSATLDAVQSGNNLVVRVTNLTGHKLISGYPEGRRMWLQLEWYDAGEESLATEGAYGPIGRSVQDLDGDTHQVESILDLDGTTIYQAKPGLDRDWANQLLALGYSPDLPFEYDRMTDSPGVTLGELGGMPAGSVEPSFHFVLNNVLTGDNRIPPFGFDRDEAARRNTLPVPATQYGNPESGESYEHWDERAFPIPVGAAEVEVKLYYQQTSWEYIQFLWLENDGLSSFLGNEGERMLDAWLNTGMSEPVVMESTTLSLNATVNVPGEAAALTVAKSATPGSLDIGYLPACDAADHNVYIGDLTTVSTYAYGDVACSIGATGSVTFNPGSGSVFFLVVANNGLHEGSYGIDGAGTQRPEDVGTPGCDRLRDLPGVVCE